MKPVDKFVGDERGNIGIEFVIWMIAFLPLLGIIIDASLLYQAHADMWTVARDGARRIALDESQPDAVQVRMTDELSQLWSYQFAVAASIDGTFPDRTAVVNISVDIEGASFFGAFSEIFGNDLVAHVELDMGDI